MKICAAIQKMRKDVLRFKCNATPSSPQVPPLMLHDLGAVARDRINKLLAFTV